MNTLTVTHKAGAYPIYMEEDALTALPALLPAHRHAYAIVDEQVFGLFKARLLEAFAGRPVSFLPLPGGEGAKTEDALFSLFRRLLSLGITRKDLILSIGGGSIGDMAGFCAATLLRGIPLVQVPSSLLAMVDSSVGGKVAINLPEGKNLVGAFYPPEAVFLFLDFLKTLPAREYASGLSEIVKMAALFDEALFVSLSGPNFHLPTAIYRAVDLKRQVVERDERDLGSRRLLNFGHTFGHAIEALYDFSGFTHGESVALGMLLALRLGERLLVAPPGLYERLSALLEALQLPSSLDPFAGRFEALLPFLSSDKKRSGEDIELILLSGLGLPEIVPTPLSFINSFLKGL